MLFEEQNIRWKHYINVLKLLKVYTIQHKTIQKFEMYLIC